MLGFRGPLPSDDWERHHALVVRVLVALSVLVPLYAVVRGAGPLHAAGHALPLFGLTVAAHRPATGRGWRGAAAALGLMTACALAVHSSDGATESHFLFFALLPLAAVYATWTPFLVAIGYVVVHHFAVGTAFPASVFDRPGAPLAIAVVHALFVVLESLVCLTAWRMLDGRRERVERLVRERTEELRAQRDVMSRLATAVEATDDAVVSATPSGEIVTWNRGAERLYGHRAAEAVGQPITTVIAPERQEAFAATLAALEHGPSVTLESLDVRRDGSRLQSSMTISNIRDERGEVTGKVVIARDITDRKRREAEAETAARKLADQADELARLALQDPLTGLANRALLAERLERVLDHPGDRPAALLLLDVDNFKAINDVGGHNAGDEVLVEVARRLVACVRPGDTVARLGGDEFVVLLEAVDGPEAAAAVADRIQDRLARPVTVGGECLEVAASVGITLTGADDRRTGNEVLRDGDTAMYVAKRSGKARYQVFASGMHDDLVAQVQLVRDLRHAVRGGELRLRYQPQIDLASGRITGVEALVRWQHPERGLLTPDRFIPTAESMGMIIAVDDWVLREACRQLREWDDRGLGPLHMAVNVSARRLVTGDLASTVGAVARAAGVDPRRLELEITETVAVEHEAEAVSAIGRVRALGARVAIDDFGMGHSALSRLQTFPVDRLKIDRSFVAGLTEGGERGSLVDAMIAMGRSLGLEVVAEGVETEEHLRALRTLGCGSAQGYLFGRPLPPPELEALVRAAAATAPLDAMRVTIAPDPPAADRERQVRSLLAELERVTGLESTYLTRIDWVRARQRVTHARNTGILDIPEGLSVDWSETVCRRALEQGISYTDDVPATFPDSVAAAGLGLQTYVSVPLRGAGGEIEGTLCGASRARVTLAPDAVALMERFADLITSSSPPPDRPRETRPRTAPRAPAG